MSRGVTVLDYGMGNLRSVQRALEAAGTEVTVADSASAARGAARLVVPGQGAFRDCMARLTETGLADVLREHWAAERPFLGICLGLQVLFEVSDEHGPVPGLARLPGRVERFAEPLTDAGGARLKIPHMGWNEVRVASDHPVFAGLDAADWSRWFYFVHSYRPVPADADDVALWCDYGGDFCAAVAHDNVVAVQFHPEKSQRAGLELLRRFLAL
jgi:glutamine amidotransferase